MKPFGTYSFMINYIVFVALTRLWIPLASIPISFPTAFHQVLLSTPINKVYIVSFPPAYCICGKHAVIRINGWQQGTVLLGWGNIPPRWTGTGVIGVELAGVPLVVFWLWGSGVFSYILKYILIHGFECGSKLGGVEGLYLGGCVGAESCVCTLIGCKTGCTLRDGAGVLMVFWCWIFAFWLCGSIGGNGKICKRGWDMLLCKMREIWLNAFFVASP